MGHDHKESLGFFVTQPSGKVMNWNTVEVS